MDKATSLKPLNDWLYANNARRLWDVEIPRVGWLNAYNVKGKVILIQGYEPTPNQFNGWVVSVGGVRVDDTS